MQYQIKTDTDMKTKKTYKEISIQCERISTLYLKGYGTEAMYQKCETIYLKIIAKIGY